MADATATAPKAPVKELPGELVIEMWDQLVPNPDPNEPPIKKSRNRNVQFPPARMILRGHWSRNSLTPSEASGEGIEQLPDEIPGIRILVNPRTRLIKVFDPLGLPEAKKFTEELFLRIARVWGDRFKPWSTLTWPEQKPDMLKTTMWWAWRMVNDGYAKVISGTLPEEAVIKAMPGKTRIEIYNNSAKAIRFREDIPREDWDAAQEAVLGVPATN